MTNPIPNPRHHANRANRANRCNALLSTGPRTAGGKQRSSLNALTHGLTSRAKPDFVHRFTPNAG